MSNVPEVLPSADTVNVIWYVSPGRIFAVSMVTELLVLEMIPVQASTYPVGGVCLNNVHMKYYTMCFSKTDKKKISQFLMYEKTHTVLKNNFQLKEKIYIW